MVISERMPHHQNTLRLRINGQLDEDLENEAYLVDGVQISLIGCRQPPPPPPPSPFDPVAAALGAANCSWVSGEGVGAADVYMNETATSVS